MKKIILLLILSFFSQLQFPATPWAMRALDFERELENLQLGKPTEIHLSGIKFRVAVFPYEDRDNTGLGNFLAALVGRHILFNAQISELGLLRYENLISAKEPGGLSYFDKVDKVVSQQGVVIALWGVIRRVDGGIAVDTYMQIPPKGLEHFTVNCFLPVIGNKPLVAGLRPDRLKIQTMFISNAAESTLPDLESFLTLRQYQDNNAPQTQKITVDETYYVTTFHEGSNGRWFRLQTLSAGGGWVPDTATVPGAFPFLNCADFAINILQIMDEQSCIKLTSWETLTTETLALSEQISALRSLQHGQRPLKSLALASLWTGDNRLTGFDPEINVDRGRGIPPGGAAFSNIYAIARSIIAVDNYEKNSRNPNELKRQLATITNNLAKASMNDPRNSDVLHNLSVLFSYLGDSRRASLADSLQQQYVSEIK